MDIDDVAPRDDDTDRTQDLGELPLPQPTDAPALMIPADTPPAVPPGDALSPGEALLPDDVLSPDDVLLPADTMPSTAVPVPVEAPPPADALPPSMQPTTLLPVVPRRRSLRFTVTVVSLAVLAVAGLVALVIGVVSPDTPDGSSAPGLGVLTDRSSDRPDRGGLAGASRPARPSSSCPASPCPSASRSRRPSPSANGAQGRDDGAESPASPDVTPSDKATGGVLSASYVIVATGSSTTLHGRLTVINGSGIAQAWSAQLSYVSGIQVNGVAPGMYVQLGSQVTVTPPTLLPAGQTLVVEINATRPADAATAPVSCAVNGRTCG